MDSSLAPLAALIRLNTGLFLNAVADLDEPAATARPNGHTNSVGFIAGHLVETRAWTARYLGLEEPSPFGGALEHATRIEDVAELPTLAAVRAAWRDLSPRVEARLDALDSADLAAVSAQRFPGVPETLLGGVAFLVQHESYHIGQLAYLRKFLGLPAMSYRQGAG